jgi:hypothetical protein
MTFIWERGEKESNLWWSRFEKYRLMGPERSFLAVYNAWRAEKGRKPATSVAGSWTKAASEHNWRERAEAWDAHILAQDAEAAEDLLRELREQRIERLRAVAGMVNQALNSIVKDDDRLTKASFNQIVDWVRILHIEMRAELGQEQPDRLIIEHGNVADLQEWSDADLAAILAEMNDDADGG